MKIIRLTPQENGRRPNIQAGPFSVCPAGYAILPEELDDSVFTRHNGFVTLTTEEQDGVPVVTGMTADLEAWETWRASLPPEQPPEPTEQEDTAAMLIDHEYRLVLLELGL